MAKNRPPKVIVTGGAGYIGAKFIPMLYHRGYDILVYDKLLFGYEALGEYADKVKIVQGEIIDFPQDLLEDAYGVVHLAGISNDPTAFYLPELNMQINTDATKRLAEFISESSVKKFIFASTCSVYYVIGEEQDELLTEESPLSPEAPYSKSKLYGEKAIYEVLDGSDLDVTILRQGTVFGWSPRMRNDLVVNTMVRDAILNNKITVHCGGSMWRPLVYVDDVCLAYIAALENSISGIYNLSYHNYRVLELAHRIALTLKRVFGVSPEIDVSFEGKTRSYRVTTDRLKQAFPKEYQPKTPVEEAVVELYNGYKQNPDVLVDPKNTNIDWMHMLSDVNARIKVMGGVDW